MPEQSDAIAVNPTQKNPDTVTPQEAAAAFVTLRDRLVLLATAIRAFPLKQLSLGLTMVVTECAKPEPLPECAQHAASFEMIGEIIAAMTTLQPKLDEIAQKFREKIVAEHKAKSQSRIVAPTHAGKLWTPEGEREF